VCLGFGGKDRMNPLDGEARQGWHGHAVWLYVALSGLIGMGPDDLSRASPWAKLSRPVGSGHLLHSEALKGRHLLSSGQRPGGPSETNNEGSERAQ